MAESLAVRYRPKNWDEVCGQKSIIHILSRQIELNEIKNAYLFCGASGCGKAQPLTSSVLTKSGYKLMKDINVGDYILDGEGIETKVLGTFPQGERKIYKILFDDNSSIEVADNHLNYIYVKDKNKVNHMTVETLQLIDMLNSGKYKIFVDIPELNSWEYSKPTIEPYLLGCLIGDGSLSGSNLSFSSKDKELIDNLDYILESEYSMKLKSSNDCDYRISSIKNYKYHIKYNDNDFFTLKSLQEALIKDGYPRIDPSTILRICNGNAKHYKNIYPELFEKIKLIEITKKIVWNSDSLKKQLKKLNLNVTAKYKHIPSEYKYNSTEVRLAVLQGIMDTDGTVTRPVESKFSGKTLSGHCSVTTISKQLSEDIAFLARSLGYKAIIRKSENRTYNYRYKNKVEKRNCSDSYTISIITNNDSELFRLTRKKRRTGKHRFEVSRRIKDITFERIDSCKCIYVESALHTYITDNETVTHNTTLARIFANKINNHVGNPIEIDGASNNGVDNVKNIIKAAQERAIDSKYKIYIIDECHSLTNQAWQAFLKCIEEPPTYTIFIFCTTDPQKIPNTILNRVQRFNISRISNDALIARLKYICQSEGYTNYDEACEYIAKISDGGARDAICTLEKCSSYDTNLCIENILESLGNYSYKTFFELINSIIDGDEGNVIKIIDNYYSQGNDLKLFVDNFINFCLDINKFAIFNDISMTSLPSTTLNDLQIAVNFEDSPKYYAYILDRLLDIKQSLKNDSNIKSTIIVSFLQITRCQ